MNSSQLTLEIMNQKVLRVSVLFTVVFTIIALTVGIEGLQYLTNLNALNLSGNRISETIITDLVYHKLELLLQVQH